MHRYYIQRELLIIIKDYKYCIKMAIQATPLKIAEETITQMSHIYIDNV